MARRGPASSPFSLFSFQDIITSVTAIMILITLMLTVELLNRKANAPPPSPIESVTELRRAIADMRQLIDELRSRLVGGAANVDELAAATADQLQLDIADWQQRNEALTVEVRRLTALAAAAQEAEQKAQADRFDRQADQAKLAELQEAAQAAHDEVARLKAENRLMFNPTPGDQKRAWLVDVAEGSFRVGLAGRKASAADFDGAWLGGRVESVADWATSLSASTDYFVLLVRPSGIESFQLLSTRLEGMGFDIGFDLISSDQTVFDPSDGSESP